MQTSIARILVENRFCSNCIDSIKNKLQEVENIQNIRLYPSDSLIVFGFSKANQISEVLNKLYAIGYPPLEDYPHKTKPILSTCKCKTLVVC